MPVLSKEFLDIQATIKCGFTLKRVRNMKRTYNLLIKFEMVKSFLGNATKADRRGVNGQSKTQKSDIGVG